MYFIVLKTHKIAHYLIVLLMTHKRSHCMLFYHQCAAHVAAASTVCELKAVTPCAARSPLPSDSQHFEFSIALCIPTPSQQLGEAATMYFEEVHHLSDSDNKYMTENPHSSSASCLQPGPNFVPGLQVFLQSPRL